jgi:ATP/maltotriose-dependent transcriptional regulator MalT
MTTLAKLTRPKLHEVIPRDRLFSRLDEYRKRPVVWVVGPPGSGKSALIASYLEAKRLKGIWYQIDAGDHDISTFFSYINLATKTLPLRRSAPLPIRSPEYLSDLPGFTRHYFRNLFERFRTPAVLTLDNYHELPERSEFHEMLAHALLEISDEINVIVISRTDPPAELARLDAEERVARLEWDLLRLTLDETRAIALPRQR